MYYSDEPISEPEQDAFGRDVFVNSLADDINRWYGEGSLVLALYGPWGSGKSSVLNLLQKKIGEYPSIEIISFDPWYFSSTEQLIQTFFTTVKNKTIAFAKNDSKKDLNDAFKKYGAALSEFVSWEPEVELPGGFKFKLGNLGKKPQEIENPENVRNDLRKALRVLDKKFVVLIDNLDRLDPPELLLMFKLVRLCSDFPSFVYLLAFDHQQVQKLIIKQGIDAEFLAKIIQIDIELPIIEQDDLDNFVEKSILSSVADMNLKVNQKTWSRFVDLYNQSLSSKLINDLRKAKRYLNTIGFTLSLVRDDVDFADFLVVEALQVFYPKIYSRLPFYKKELTTFESGYGLSPMRVLWLAELKEIKEWLTQELPDKTDRQVCEQLMGFLFPPVGAYFDNQQNPTIIVREDEHMANQRICIPQYFDMYFKFRLPKGEIPSLILNSIQDELNNAEKESTQNVEALILGEKDRLSQLLSKLYFRVDNVNVAGRIKLIRIFGKLGKILEWELLNSWNASGVVAVRVLVKCIERFENNSDMQDSIQEVISSTSSLSFASEIIFELLSDNRQLKVGQAEKEVLKSIMIARLHKELLEENQNVFVLYPTSYYRILALWQSDKILGEKEIATNYVYNQLSKDVHSLPKLLITYATFELVP